MDFYYHDAWRMDWGLGNPNKTATLIACLMIAVWSLALIWKRGFWLALLVSTALAWCLVQTYSRGGMVAFLAGIAVLLHWLPRPWPKARGLGVVTSLWLLGAFVLLARAQMRYGQGLFPEDQSVGNRLEIWKHVPEMMVAAPRGWGFGEAGDAYTQWFQPFSQSQSYLNLVNSHFNFMVEAGWIASAFYLFAWFAIFLLCWPLEQSWLKAIPLALWVTFGVAACFSHVEESIWLWIFPVFALVYVVWERFRVGEWPSSLGFIFSGAISMALVAALIGVGVITTSLPIKWTHDLVIVGKGKAGTVVFVDRKVMGSLYGHSFRKFLARNLEAISQGSYCFVESSDHLAPASATLVVVSGRFAGEDKIDPQVDRCSQIIFVNPMSSPDDTGLNHNLIERATVYFGEYCEARSRSSWTNIPHLKALQIEGAGDFIPSWPQAILNSPKS
jgi:hypothetical protein